MERLNELDSTAFYALENGLPDVEQKAEKLLNASEQYESALHLINANTLLGIVNKNKGYYVTAVDYYNKALAAAEEAEDQGRISACYNNIGSVYQIQENFPKALSYFQKSLEIEEQLNNPLQKSIRLYNIGDMYREMDSLSLALSNFNSSLIIEKENQNSEGIVYALLGVADIYLKLDKRTDAQISLDEAKKHFGDSDIEIGILYHLLSAELDLRNNSFDSALHKLKEAKNISKKHDFKVHLRDIYEKEVAIKEAQEAFEKESEEKAKQPGEFIPDFVAIPSFVLFVVIVIILMRRKRMRREKSEWKTGIHQNDEDQKFVLKSETGKTLLNVSTDKIVGFEANDNYVITYYLSNTDELKKSMERASLKKVEELLDSHPNFFRVHKSHIINKKYVQSIEGKSQAYKIRLQLLEATIPVSRSFDIKRISE
ncbi:MAG: hypothetical protein Crog4KO_27480 [Crocinitomicaceae bacterium]